MTTAYSHFLPKRKEPEGWSVRKTWMFCIAVSGGFWVVVALIVGAVL
jgi:hypothetical protein